MRPSRLVAFTLLTVLALASQAAADESAVKGRAVFEQHKSAVITVHYVLSLSFGGEERERESEATATIIGADGMAVLSLSAVDPSMLYASMSADASDMVSKVVSLKYLMPGGDEVPAEIVLRDKELDLGFLRPIEAVATPMQHVDLSDSARVGLLDEVVTISQLGKVARRTHTVFVERVEALVEKPRLFYVLPEERSRVLLCSPVFNIEGRFVGIGVMRSIRGGQNDSYGESMMAIIVPAEDIVEAAEQAPPAE